MPRFFFHLYDDIDVLDEDGTQLPDVAAAVQCAATEARSLMCDTIKTEGPIVLDHRIEIEDEHGAVVATVPFRDALKIEG
jgi:hypothetical protein